MGINLSWFCHWLLFLFILCPLHAGCLTAAELVHFSKALGHSWTIFAQKIGYEAEELKVAGSSKLSKKAFFAKIWLVPKFDDDQVKNLLCELLTAIQLDISTLVTSASTFKMSLLDASEGSRSDLDMVSTETETETETPSESEEERAKNEVSFVGQNCNSLGAKVASQSDSGLVSAPSSGSAAWSMETSLSASSVPPTCEVYSDSDSPFSSRNRDEVPAATAVGPSSGSRGIHCKGQSKKLEASMSCMSMQSIPMSYCSLRVLMFYAFCAYLLYCFGFVFVCCCDTLELFGRLVGA